MRKKNASKINIAGFRKGKAPRAIIEKMYGVEIMFEDAFNIIAPDAYDKAIEENNISPVAQPEIDIVQIGNAVPPLISKVIADKIMEMLETGK